MNLERLAAALERRRSSGHSGRGARPRLRRPGATPGALFFCVPGSRVDGHDFAPKRSRAAPSHSWLSGRSPSACPRSSLRTLAPRWQSAQTSSSAADRGAAGRRRHRDEREDDDVVPPVRDPRGRRAAPGTPRNGRGARRRRTARRRAHDTGGDRPAADVPRDARRGDRSCAMEASSHASELHRLDRVRFSVLVFTNLSQDISTSTETWSRTSRRSGGSSPSPPPAVVNVGDEYGRRLASRAAGLRSRSSAADDSIGRDCARRGSSSSCAAASTSRTRSGRSRPRALLGIDDDAIERGVESVRGVPAGSKRRRGTAVHGDRRLRAQAGRARQSAARRSRLATGRVIVVVGAAAIATAASGR